MDINDLDEDEFAHLVQWLMATPFYTGLLDLRTAPAWRFAKARAAVDAGDITEFPDVGGRNLADDDR